MTRAQCGARVRWTAVALLVSGVALRAHSGPPFPIVSGRVVGAYEISIWTDPDATDDGSAAGRFWVMVEPARKGAPITSATTALVRVSPLDNRGTSSATRAEGDGQDPARRFAALVLDHEGPYAVHVAIDGPLGPAEITANVDATYDLRPRPFMLGLALVPFLLVGFLWLKLLLRRRRVR